MRDDNFNYIEMIKFMYGLVDYKRPDNIVTKAFIFYCTDEEKSVLETNHIYYLNSDCTKDDVIDIFNNKLKTEKYIGFQITDLKLAIFASEELSIPSVYLMIGPDIAKTFNFTGLSVTPTMFKADSAAEERIKELILNKLIIYKYVAFTKDVVYASIDKDFQINDETIGEILNTKYNIENIFREDYQQISKMVDDYARSKH